jgi:hypothetical protein
MSYPTAVESHSSLVSYWRLGESSGTTAVDETSALPLTYTGGPTLGAPSLISDSTNKSVLFDGVDDQATAGIDDTWGGWSATDQTIALITIPSSTPGSNTRRALFSVSTDPGATDAHFEFGYYSPNGTDTYACIYYYAKMYGFDFFYGVYGDTPLSLTERSHIAYVTDYTEDFEWKIYVNGVLQTLTDYPGTYGNHPYGLGDLADRQRLTLGGSVRGSLVYTDATLDEVAFFDATLSASDIEDLFDAAGEPAGPAPDDIDADIPLKSFTQVNYSPATTVPGSDNNTVIPLYSYNITNHSPETTKEVPPIGVEVPKYQFSLQRYSPSLGGALLVREDVRVSSLMSSSFTLPVLEGLYLSGQMTASELAVILEMLSVSGTPSTEHSMFNLLNETIRLSDLVRQILPLLVSEDLSVGFSAANYNRLIGRVFERVSATDSSFSVGEFSLAFTLAMGISSFGAPLHSVSLSEMLGLSAGSIEHFTYVENVVNEAIISSFTDVSTITLAIAEEDLSLLFGISVTGSFYLEDITEAVRLFVSRGNDLGYEAFVMNPENYALSRYDNFNFKDSCRFKDDYLFSNEEGIFRLEGVYDYPTKYITSKIKTASLDFGTSNKKQVPKMYIGTTNSGSIILKVSVDGRNSTYYQLNLATENLDTQLIDIGKGLIGRYFQFELSTKGNSAFDVDELELFPILLGRKVR